MKKLRQLSVLVKPTHRCNLDCQYCYDRAFKINDNMSLEMVEEIAQFVSRSCDNILWIWHGGEPLLMGIGFYKEAKKILDKYGITRISMQSNGVLLNDEYIKFFNENNWNISFSYDCSSHDTNRGKGDIVLQNMKRYYEQTGRKLSIIKVVDSNNYMDMLKDYDFLKEQEWFYSISINRVFNSPSARYINDDIENAYMVEYGKLFDKWMNDENPIHIRQFDEMLPFILNDCGFVCNQYGRCYETWLCFNPIGDIYPCDRWFKPQYKYGNIKEYNDIFSLRENSVSFNNVKYHTHNREKYCKEIQKCKVFKWCNGGCTANSLYNEDPNLPDEHFCRIVKKELSFILNYLMNCDKDKVRNPNVKSFLDDIGFRNINLIKEVVNDER